jgi:hypothetical protein
MRELRSISHGNDVFSNNRQENKFMRSKLILVVALAAVLVLVSAEIGTAAKKITVEAVKPQNDAAKLAQPQTPMTQPETISSSPSLSSTPVDPLIFETPGPTNINASPKAGEQINWQVLASGGGTQTLGTLVLSSTIGQTVAGQSSTGSYLLQSGFWQNFGGGYLCGDLDGSGSVNIADVVYLVSYIFSGGPAPVPLASADVDCGGTVNIADAVYLIEYIFTYGAAPCAACK